MDADRWSKVADATKFGALGREIYAEMRKELSEPSIVDGADKQKVLAELETFELTCDAIRREPQEKMAALTLNRRSQAAALVGPMSAALEDQNSVMEQLELRLSTLDTRAKTVDENFMALPMHEAIPVESHGNLKQDLERALEGFGKHFAMRHPTFDALSLYEE